MNKKILEATALYYNLQSSFYICIMCLNLLVYIYFKEWNIILFFFPTSYIVIIFPC